MRFYVFTFTLISMFPAFWIGLLILSQASNPKNSSISVFPSGLNDAAALIPLALAAFAGLLFSAQQSVPASTTEHRNYGKAARRMLLSFYFLAISFLDAVGARIMHDGTFDRFPLAFMANEIAKIIPGLCYLNGLIAFLIITNALWNYVLTIRR